MSLHVFNREFVMVIYSKKIMLVINCKDVRSDRFSWPFWYLMFTIFLLVVIPERQGIWGRFWLPLLCHYLCWSNILTHMPALLFFSMPIWSMCSSFSVFLCCDVGIIIFSLVAKPPVIDLSSLNGQYGYNSFVPQPTYKANHVVQVLLIHQGVHLPCATLISSTAMQSGMSLHDYFIDCDADSQSLFIYICFMVVSE